MIFCTCLRAKWKVGHYSWLPWSHCHNLEVVDHSSFLSMSRNCAWARHAYDGWRAMRIRDREKKKKKNLHCYSSLGMFFMFLNKNFKKHLVLKCLSRGVVFAAFRYSRHYAISYVMWIALLSPTCSWRFEHDFGLQ